jgi:hypothetical protein
VNVCVYTYTKPRTSSTRSRSLGWRIHRSVEDTKLSTNKQHSLRACPCERVFHAQVCELQITHISIIAARQRQHHYGRACPCERVFHARVCALHRTHLSVLAARQRQCHDSRAYPCERVFHAQVCALTTHISLFLQHIKDNATMAGLAPASVCSTLRCVNFKSHTSSIITARQRQCHDSRACPCERVFHAQVCALIPHISLFS